MLAYAALVVAALADQTLVAPPCASASVTDTVNSIAEDKLLHVAKFSVAIVDIRRLDGDFFFGDRRCRAGLTVGGRPDPRTVEYRWTGRKGGALGTVYAKLR